MENHQTNPTMDQTRLKGIKYFGICIILVFVSYFFAKNFMSKNFLKAKAEFDVYGFDILHLDYIFFILMGPFIYSGWTTLSKVIGLLNSNTQWFVSPILWLFLKLFKLICSFMIGAFIFPILIILNLLRIIFGEKINLFNLFNASKPL